MHTIIVIICLSYYGRVSKRNEHIFKTSYFTVLLFLPWSINCSAYSNLFTYLTCGHFSILASCMIQQIAVPNMVLHQQIKMWNQAE